MGPIKYPSRSLDLTSMDFFLWESLQQKTDNTETAIEYECTRYVELNVLNFVN